MAIRKRGGIWWARFTVAGKRYEVSLGTSDRRHALNEEKDRIAKASEGKLALPGTPFARLAFGQAVDQYIADRKSRVEPKTTQTDLERGKAVKAKLAHLHLKQITAELLLSYMRQRKEEGLSNSTVNHELNVIRGVLKRAKRWAVISEDVKPLPVRESSGQVLSYEEKLRLIRWAKERPAWQSMRLAMTIALNTTMRNKEVRLLRWRDVNLFEKSIEVRRSKTEAGERQIPLNADAFAAVLELRDRAKHLFGETIEADWFLFPRNADANAKGKEPDPLHPVGSWRSAWRTLTRSIRCRECQLMQKPGKSCWSCGADISKLVSSTSGFRFHDLRHQAITELREAGADDTTVMGIAGHLSRKMLERYSHVRTVLKRAAVDRIGRGGHGTVVGQSDQFPMQFKSQVAENNGGRCRTRTCDPLLVRTAVEPSNDEQDLAVSDELPRA